MGKENTIRTGTNAVRTNTGLSLSAYNLNQKLPKSIYSFAIVTDINPSTKDIVYNIIEDNLGLNKVGTAKPLYPNKIVLPQIGSIVPLLRGPDIGVSTNAGMYDKTTYYMDPIGIQQTVNDNIIIKEVQKLPPESNVTQLNIKQAELGIPNK
jgi:hypothetical protein